MKTLFKSFVLCSFGLLPSVAHAQLKQDPGGAVCWMQTSGRPVAGPPSECGPGETREGALCYAPCKAGYGAVATVCWQSCPKDWKDIGASCAKPGTYTRRPYPSSKACINAGHGHLARGCEQIGALWYAVAKDGFKCTADTCTASCPAGFRDDGLNCEKDHYERGKPLRCSQGLEEQAGLCYSPCPNGSKGAGVVCWQDCPSSYPVRCGAACAKTKQDCDMAVSDQVISVVNLAITIATAFELPGASSAIREVSTRAVTRDVLKANVAKLGEKEAAEEGGRAVVRGGARGGSGLGADLKKLGSAMIKTGIATIIGTRIDRGVANGVLKDAWVKANGTPNPKQTENMSNLFDGSGGGTFDYTMLDPTGVSSVVMAFMKPMCGNH